MKKKRTIGSLYLWVVVIISVGMVNLQAQTVGNAAPDFELNLLGGGTFKLSEQEGKVVFIFLFGNTCGPCQSVAPKVESEIYQEFKNNEAFVAIGMDTWDFSSDATSVQGFKNVTGVTFPLAIKAGSVETDYSTSHDRLMVVDKEGILVHKGQVAASNDIGNVKDVITASLTATGIRRSADATGLNIYPHPASDLVTFDSEEGVSDIRIYNVTGKLVLEMRPESAGNSLTLHVGHLEQGIYFYSLESGDHQYTGKLFIQR